MRTLVWTIVNDSILERLRFALNPLGYAVEAWEYYTTSLAPTPQRRYEIYWGSELRLVIEQAAIESGESVLQQLNGRSIADTDHFCSSCGRFIDIDAWAADHPQHCARARFVTARRRST